MKITRYLTILVAALTLFASCSKDRGEQVMELLKTVPSSAGVVAVIDGEQIIEKGGGADAVFAEVKDKQTVEALSKAWEPQAAVIFSDGYRVYLTTNLSDPEALVKYAASKGETFTETTGVKMSRSMAIKGEQVWISLTGGMPEAGVILNYTDLSKNQSYASCDYAEKLCDDDKELSFIGDMSALLNLAGGSNVMMARIALSSTFKDAAYLAGDLEFEKGKVEADVKVLDSKYRMAEFLFPTTDVNTGVIEMTAPRADIYMALSVPSAMVKKIKDAAASLGGGLDMGFTDMLNAIDGTIAAAADAGGRNVSAVFTTNGGATGALSQFLASSGMNVRSEGNHLFGTIGSAPAGSIPAAEAASELKGSIGGIVMSAAAVKAYEKSQNPNPVDRVVIAFDSEHKGLEFKLVIRMADKNQNALRTLISTASAAR